MPATATQPAATTARAAPPVSPEPPRIVVTVVLDQLGSWVLDRYLPHLPESGALRSAARRGAHYQKVRYQYASTFTAPGHSALYTGVGPSENGVMANRVRDATTNEKVALIDDSEHLVIGDDSKGVSPRALGAPTVADALEEQTGGRSVTVSLSVKDRGAILPGGQRADLALWYETSQRAFTTSTFYRSELPAWLVAWREAHPTRALMHAWEPRDAALLARVAGKDDALGEGDYLGFGTTFPHDPRTGDKPHKLLKLTPQLSEHMLELARAVVVHMGMGQDAVPDLLAISVSGTDYLGHTFGPESWEYLDNLIRVDLALGSFLSWLENEHGPIAVIITADHGSQALPEQHDGAGRMYPEQLRQAAEKAAAAVAGPGKWIRAFDRPFFYLTAAGRAKRDIVVPAIVEKLTALEGVQLVGAVTLTS